MANNQRNKSNNHGNKSNPNKTFLGQLANTVGRLGAANNANNKHGRKNGNNKNRNKNGNKNAANKLSCVQKCVQGGGRGRGRRTRRKGGDLGLQSLLMPAGVNPFLTAAGLAALSSSGKRDPLVKLTRPLLRKRRRSVSKSRKRTTRKKAASKSRERTTRKKAASKSRNRSASKSRKRTTRKKSTRRRTVRRGGNIMNLLFPRGLTPTLTAAGLAALSQSGRTTKRSVSRKRRSVSKKPKRKVVRRKSTKKRKVTRKKRGGASRQTGGKRTASRKGGQRTVSKRGGKRTASRKGGQRTVSKRGGGCPWTKVGGSKKKKVGAKRGGKGCGVRGHSKKHKPHKRKSGGGSDWMTVQYARGPSNAGNKSWCGSARSQFGAFANSSQYVPNSVLARGWANPQLAGLDSKMCGSK